MKMFFLTLLATSSLFANKFYYEFGKKVEIENSISTQQSLSTTDSTTNHNQINQYTTKDGKKIKFKNEILVQCKKNAYCEDDFADLSLANYKKIGSTYFLIKTSNNDDIFLIMQQLDAKDDIKSAHPNYIINRLRR